MRMLASLVAYAVLSAAAPDTVPPSSCAAVKATRVPQAFLAVAPGGSRDSVVRATVCVTLPTASSAKIGSYHGELHFDSTAVGSVRVLKVEGGMRVENATIPGRVNFAGAAPTGFPQGALVSVALRLRKPGVKPALHFRMLELNTTDGADLMKQLPPSPTP